MSADTSRSLWIRTFAGQAMQSMILLPGYSNSPAACETLARNAVNIAKALLDDIEGRQSEWIAPNYKGPPPA